MAITAVFLTLAEAVVKSVAVRYISNGASSSFCALKSFAARILVAYPPILIKRYTQNLSIEMASMPFIYRDLKGKILDDFVEPQFNGLDISTLQPIQKRQVTSSEGDERLRRKRKVLFIGNAGIGKTTYQRRTISLLLSEKQRVTFLRKEEAPIPIYIPLKAVDNSGAHPILRYIFTQIQLFAHDGGVKLFETLAQQSRLFLFIDGYDEIAVAASDSNYVREELAAIVFPKDYPGSPLHTMLQSCRVWISTREDFFKENPFGDIGAEKDLAWRGVHEADTTVVAMHGITDRQAFVRILFEKYRDASETYKEYLDEEFFLNHIDMSGDGEIEALSHNPLFLSVMVYVYADSVIKNRSSKAPWLADIHILIDRCIDLLLEELDQLKSARETEGRRLAIQTRRNLYKDEKKSFLQEFAYKLFLEGYSLFSFELLKGRARSFAEALPTSNGRAILATLSDERKRTSDFTLDLINCGALRRVSKSGKEVMYDFPHRHFREVLAAQHINSARLYCDLLKEYKDKQLHGLLTAFKRRSYFHEPSMQREALRLFLGDCVNAPAADLVEVLNLFLDQMPSDVDIAGDCEQFALACAITPYSNVLASAAILRGRKFDNSVIERLKFEFRNCVGTGNVEKLSVVCSILKESEPQLLTELLRGQLTERFLPNATWAVILQYGVLNSCALVFDNLHVFDESDKALAIVARVLGRYAATQESASKLADETLEYFRVKDKHSLFLYFLAMQYMHHGARRGERCFRCPAKDVDSLYILTRDGVRDLGGWLNKFSGRTLILACELKVIDDKKQDRSKTKELVYYLQTEEGSKLRRSLVDSLVAMKFELFTRIEFTRRLNIAIEKAIDNVIGRIHGQEIPVDRVAEIQRKSAFVEEIITRVSAASLVVLENQSSANQLCEEVAEMPMREHFV